MSVDAMEEEEQRAGPKSSSKEELMSLLNLLRLYHGDDGGGERGETERLKKVRLSVMLESGIARCLVWGRDSPRPMRAGGGYWGRWGAGRGDGAATRH